MKGHLGFRCRACVKPSEPTNLRQVGTGVAGSSLSATLAWDAPAVTGGGPILAYKIEKATNESNTQWEVVAEVGPTPRQISLQWCDYGTFRVSARNRCGWGATAGFGQFVFGASGSVTLLTASASVTPPCWAMTVKFWCVGCGGNNGGAMAWKSWTRLPGEAWSGSFACSISNQLVNGTYPYASVSHSGTTVTAYGSVGGDSGWWVGGDGGANGSPGGNSYSAYDSASPYYHIVYPFTGTPTFSGPYNFGGAAGAALAPSYPGHVSPCRRLPAVNRSGLLDAVALLGMRVTEECDAEPAFGSGAVSFTIGLYGGGTQRINFSAGYGGGGIDATNPGGPGCIVVRYS